eukprot:GAHX01001054.1.p1 GENE.GAHX01001054.1~~GAHX01001054.1.p1  ORF type:complete len:523 (+),score=62.85 GAHX01001054.1:88-1656(+)
MYVLALLFLLTSFALTTLIAFFTSNIIFASICGLFLLQFITAEGIGFHNPILILSKSIPAVLEEHEMVKLILAMVILSGCLEIILRSKVMNNFIKLVFRDANLKPKIEYILLLLSFVFSCDDTIMLLFLTSFFKSALSENASPKELLNNVIITDGLSSAVPWFVPFSSEAAYLIYCLHSSLGDLTKQDVSRKYLGEIPLLFFPIIYTVDLFVKALFRSYMKKERAVEEDEQEFYSNSGETPESALVIKKQKDYKINPVICVICVLSIPVCIWISYIISGVNNVQKGSIKNMTTTQYAYAILWSADSNDALLNAAVFCFLLNYILISFFSSIKQKKLYSLIKNGVNDVVEISILTIVACCFADKIEALKLERGFSEILKKTKLQPALLSCSAYFLSLIITGLMGNSWFSINLLFRLFKVNIQEHTGILASIVSGGSAGEMMTILSETRTYYSNTLKIDLSNLNKLQFLKCIFPTAVSGIFGHLLVNYVGVICSYVLCTLAVVGFRLSERLYINRIKRTRKGEP